MQLFSVFSFSPCPLHFPGEYKRNATKNWYAGAGLSKASPCSYTVDPCIGFQLPSLNTWGGSLGKMNESADLILFNENTRRNLFLYLYATKSVW